MKKFALLLSLALLFSSCVSVTYYTDNFTPAQEAERGTLTVNWPKPGDISVTGISGGIGKNGLFAKNTSTASLTYEGTVKSGDITVPFKFKFNQKAEKSEYSSKKKPTQLKKIKKSSFPDSVDFETFDITEKKVKSKNMPFKCTTMTINGNRFDVYMTAMIGSSQKQIELLDLRDQSFFVADAAKNPLFEIDRGNFVIYENEYGLTKEDMLPCIGFLAALHNMVWLGHTDTTTVYLF